MSEATIIGPITDRTIDIVVDAFLVVAAVAIERFLTEYPLGAHDPAFQLAKKETEKEEEKEIRRKDRERAKWRYKWFYLLSLKRWYKVSYTFSLIIIVTLVLRFLIGSDSQLRHTYLSSAGKHWVDRFIVDVCFLMLFGGFIVLAAISHHVCGFMKWLAWCSLTGVVWCVKDLWYPPPDVKHQDLPYWWLWINLTQFLITSAAYLWLKSRHEKGENGREIVHGTLIFATLWFALIFNFDVKHILTLPAKGEPPAATENH